MIRNIAIISVLAALTGIGALHAQPLASAGMSPDARSAGFAGASVAMDAHGMSLYSNMAATSFSDYRTQAAYGFSSLGNDSYLHSVGAYFRLNDKHTVAIGARYMSFDFIENTSDGIEFTRVRPFDVMIDAAYAHRLNDHLALSANMRFVNSKLNEGSGFENASAVAIDLGMHYRRDEFSIAASVANLGMLLDYGVAKYRMPASAKVGGAYRWSPLEGHRLTGLAEVRYNFMPDDYRFVAGGAGAEYMFRDMVAVRGGYWLASETKAAGNYGSIGAGAYFGPVTLDLAYNLAANDSPMHKVWRISAGVRF